MISDALEKAARDGGEELGQTAVPVFTYLANAMRVGDRQVPYSLVSGINLRALPTFERQSRSPTVARSAKAATCEAPDLGEPLTRLAPDSIVLNDWTARELNAKAGDTAQLDFYLWDAAAGLRTSTATFTVAAIVPMTGLAADRRLAPEYPGITDADSLSDWDPPFPLDLSRVRPQDEAYWHDHRTTPKAFIAYERARELWSTRYGSAHRPSLRRARRRERGQRWRRRCERSCGSGSTPVVAGHRADAGAAAGARGLARRHRLRRVLHLLQLLHRRLGAAAGGAVLPARHRAAAAADRRPARHRATPSVISAGCCRPRPRCSRSQAASSASPAPSPMRLSSCYGLRTWWVGAVGTTLLELHVGRRASLIGFAGGMIASLALRGAVAAGRVAAQSAGAARRALDRAAGRRAIRGDRRRGAHIAALLALASRWRPASSGRAAQAGAFFGAGAALLTAFLFMLSSWLRSRDATRHRRPRDLGAVPARLPRRGVPAGAQRALGGADRLGGVHHRLGRRVPPRRRRAHPAIRRRAPADTCCWRSPSCRSCTTPTRAAGREALIVQSPAFARAGFTRFRLAAGRRRELPESLSSRQSDDRRAGRLVPRERPLHLRGLARRDRAGARQSLAAAPPSVRRRRRAGDCRRDVAAVRAARGGRRHVDRSTSAPQRR